jgi:ubiquinone/menaquinone biosynthesis C-methylase UbiE
MTRDSHEDVVSGQFGPQARAYLTSAVHASGKDLDEMVRRIGQRPDDVALDLGCGGGHVTFRLAPLVKKVIAYDLSEAMLAVVAEEAARRGLTNVVTQRGVAETLPHPPDSFDLVVTRYSAHHWADARAGVREMGRVLRRGGRAIVLDVIAPASPLLDTWLQTLELLRDPSHVRNYSLAEWRSMLAGAGLQVLDATEFPVRLEFAAWVARMRTPEAHVTAIRSLQEKADAGVKAHFAFEEDGSFAIGGAFIEAAAS